MVDENGRKNMKVLALSILFIMMFSRVKSTPTSLSKKLWYKKKVKQLERDKLRDDGRPVTKTTQGIYILILLLTSMFFIIFYIMLGNKIGTTGFIVVSALQVFSWLWMLCRGILDFKIAFSYNIIDYKFYRFQRLFSLVLDYVYYPWAIYMLLK